MLKVYGRPTCVRCTRLKQWLEVKEIEYDNVDISKDMEALDKLTEANRLSLPVVEIDNEFVDFEEYNDLLEMI